MKLCRFIRAFVCGAILMGLVYLAVWWTTQTILSPFMACLAAVLIFTLIQSCTCDCSRCEGCPHLKLGQGDYEREPDLHLTQ